MRVPEEDNKENKEEMIFFLKDKNCSEITNDIYLNIQEAL